MNIEELYDYCLSIALVESSFPFDEVTLVLKVLNKIVAIILLDAEVKSISLKCDPERAVALREQYSSVTPAYHMNKKNWNSIELAGDMPDEEIKGWIHHSIEEVVKKMSKKIQQEFYGTVE